MKIMSLNVNGIRAAARKGFFQWLEKQDADFVCLQEIKAHITQLEDAIFYPTGYHCYYREAEKKGYSGVAIYAKHKPDRIVTELGWDVADREGRYIKAEYKNFNVISIYLPSGTSGEERQLIKFDFLDRLHAYLEKIKGNGKSYFICGDWNIAHKKVDLKNWRGNQKNSGFLPEERTWMDELYGPMGFVDAFRVVNQASDQYTWWSNRGQAWLKNVGWRIDYQVITSDLKDAVKQVDIYKDERFSDHAPLIIDYHFDKL